MIGKSLVDELSEDKEQDEKIIKSFYAKDTLSQDIFQGTKMIDSVRNKLLSIADNFIDFLGVDFFVHDVVLTGSLANYNWSEFSDIDLHIIIDYEESGHSQGLLKEFFDAKKAAWNTSHDIKIKNYEVELYVQDMKEKHISSGVYSVLNNKWIIEPQKEKKEIDDRKILEKGEEYGKIIDDLSKKGGDIDDVRKKLKRFRQTGLEDGGEYSYENLTFKLLRRNGYIEKLMNLKKKATDSQYSVNDNMKLSFSNEHVFEHLLNEGVDFNYKDVLRVEKKAVKFYGSSDSFNRAVGFISPSGYLLDFGQGSGERIIDHRNIGYILDMLPDIDLGEYGTDKWRKSTSWALYAVMDMGFIRYLPESQSIDMFRMPTQEQFEKIRQLIQKYNGRIILEMNEDGYVEYESDTPEEYIIEGIKKYYNEGIKPRPYEDMENDEMFLDRDMDEDVMSKGKKQMFGIPDDDEETNKRVERHMELEKSKNDEEQPFGYIHRYDFNNKFTNYPVYKNPKSLKNFDSRARAMCDPDGNLYVAKDNGNFSHEGLSEVLLLTNVYDQMDNYPLLNRVGDTNDFGLSDSTAEYISKDRIDIRNVMKIIRMSKRKNPQYGFYLEDYRKIGPQHKRI